MPLYDYRCSGCGPFRVMRPMADSALPARCPACSVSGARVLVAPSLVAVGTPLRQAQDRAAASADSPAVVGLDALRR